MAIERVDCFPLPHLFTVEEYLAFEEKSEFKHEFIDGVIYDWGDPDPNASVHPAYVPGFLPPHLFTVEEYLAFEADSEFKHEFIDGVIYDMTGGTFNHSRVKLNAIFALELQLRGSNYIVCNSDMRVEAAAGRHIYPDLSVVFGKPILKDNETTLLNPILTAEVTSPSSLDYDRRTKLDYYRGLSSLQAYLIVDQHQIMAELHTLEEAGWMRQTFSAIDGIIPLPMLDCQLPLAEIYRGISFESA